MKKFGKPSTAMPRCVRGPSFHFSAIVTPPRPRTSMVLSVPVTASKPVANTIRSASNSRLAVRTPFAVISVIGSPLTSTRLTFSRLNVS